MRIKLNIRLMLVGLPACRKTEMQKWHYPTLAPAGAGHSNSCPISSSIAAYSVKTQFSSIIIIVYTVVACIDRSLGAYI